MLTSGSAGFLTAFLDCAGSGGNDLQRIGENVKRWGWRIPTHRNKAAMNRAQPPKAEPCPQNR